MWENTAYRPRLQNLEEVVEVKSFTYGTYYKQGLLNLQKMDDHIAKMLSEGWEILTQTAHGGERRVLRPFSKRDTITISFRKA